MFETLIPKPMMQHYISLLLKHRRLVLSGPSGTGKTYLTNRLAEYLVERSGREVTEGIVSTFNMHQQSCKVAASQDPASAVPGLGLPGPRQALPAPASPATASPGAAAPPPWSPPQASALPSSQARHAPSPPADCHPEPALLVPPRSAAPAARRCSFVPLPPPFLAALLAL